MALITSMGLKALIVFFNQEGGGKYLFLWTQMSDLPSCFKFVSEGQFSGLFDNVPQ